MEKIIIKNFPKKMVKDSKSKNQKTIITIGPYDEKMMMKNPTFFDQPEKNSTFEVNFDYTKGNDKIKIDGSGKNYKKKSPTIFYSKELKAKSNNGNVFDFNKKT